MVLIQAHDKGEQRGAGNVVPPRLPGLEGRGWTVKENVQLASKGSAKGAACRASSSGNLIVVFTEH